MPLTLGEATRAGELAAAIREDEAAIADIDLRIAENAEIAAMMVILANGNQVRADGAMNAAQSRAVFEFARSILQARLDAHRAELAAL